MVHLYMDGHVQEALNLQLKLLTLINALFIEVNPIPVKTAMNLMGMKVGGLRLPLTDMDELTKQHLVKELTALALLSNTLQGGR